MPGIRCQEGIREAADALLKDAATPEDKEIFLFSNDFTITKDTVDSDLTEIDNTNGCGKKTLTKALFAAATDADPVVCLWNGATGAVWEATGPETIYGWAIRGVTSGKLYQAKNWGVNTVADGNSVTVQPLEIKFPVVMA